MKKNEEPYKIADAIYAWLNEFVPIVQSNSDHTIRSYKMSLSLYADFLKRVKKIEPKTLAASCFSKPYMEEWIKWLKTERQCCPQTCNNRLAALRSFLEYLGSKDISLLFLSQQANAIPFQKTWRKKISGLSRNAVKTLLATPNLLTKTGRRDITIMAFLYATAARINEVLSVKVKHLFLHGDKPFVTVNGKGNKIRTLYLLPKVVSYLETFLKEFHANEPNPDAYLFYSCHAGATGKMTPEAVNKLLKKHAVIAHNICNEVPVTLHAHQLRHAKASHWLEDGMNVVQISFLLGHANLNTTMVYLDITTGQEAKALVTIEDEETRKMPKKWKNNNDLSTFLALQSIK